MGQNLFNFLEPYSDNVDLLLFQEVFRGGYSEPQGNLTNIKDPDPKLYENLVSFFPNYEGYFCSVFDDVYGIALFVKKSISVIDSGEVILYNNPDFPHTDKDLDHTRKMQWVLIQKDAKKYLIMNVHGTWSVFGKGDSPERLEQSRAILTFIDAYDPENRISKILVGDFNLRPETRSIALLEERFINLINVNNISTTRTSLYTRGEKFADYAFVSHDVHVKKFAVVMQNASDHAAIDLEF